MGGGLMQLVAYGAQDIYLTGNPQITFFKVVYRRHTNFSLESIQQTIQGNGSVGATAQSGTVTISRNGDLVSDVWVTSETADIGSGDQIINQVELEIGGQRIDKQTKQWMQIWAELSLRNDQQHVYKCMTGCAHANEGGGGEAGGIFGTTGAGGDGSHGNVGIVQIPLHFWFCRNPGLALPLIALQYHEVKLKFTWGTTTEVGIAAACQVWCDYIYLDTDERRRFAQVSHEYLIEQIQYQSADVSGSFKLNFNHPVKELIWTSLQNLSPIGTSMTLKASVGTTQLVLNGHDRFAKQYEEYFQLRQPFKYHTNTPGTNLPTSGGTSTSGSIAHHEASRDYIANHDTGTGTGAAASTLHATISENATIGGIAGSTCQLLVGTGFIASAASANFPQVGDWLPTSFVDRSEGTIQQDHMWSVVAVVSQTDGWNITLFTPDQIGTNWPVTVSGHDQVTIRYVARVQHGKAHSSTFNRKVNVYSFALKPEEHQPSGTCNFSRIDTAKLNISTATGMTAADNIYAVNYNVLRIMSGMGGLAYSN